MRASSILWCSTNGGNPLALAAVATLVIWLAAMSGCGNASDSPGHAIEHAHEEEDAPPTESDIDMPRDYSLAIGRIKQYRQQVLSAVAGGHPHEAHRPLDEMNLVIGKLMSIARESGVPRTDWEEVNVARRELRAQFDVVHAALDAEQQPDMATAERDTAATLARLEGVAAKLPASADHPAAPTGHDAPVEEASP